VLQSDKQNYLELHKITPATAEGSFSWEVSDKLCAAEFERVSAKGEPCTSPLRKRAQTLWETFLGLAGFSNRGTFFHSLENL